MIKANAVPSKPSIRGLREMEEKDVDGVEKLYNEYMKRFKLIPQYSKDEVRHNLLSGRGEGEPGEDGVPGRRRRQVVWTYVVEVQLVLLSITDMG